MNLALDFLGEYRLPKLEFEGTPVGGLSGITYDRQNDRFYVISDDRSQFAPARFYTLKLTLNTADLRSSDPDLNESQNRSSIQAVEIERTAPLLNEDGTPYPPDSVDLEGIALSPRHTLFIASEGVSQDDIPPFIDEFNLETGQWLSRLPIPQRYLPTQVDGQPFGVQNNLSFESLTLNADGSTGGQLEPFRIFASTESALQQDLPIQTEIELENPEPDRSIQPIPVRLLHYLVGDPQPTLLSEHLYLIDPSEGVEAKGLTELLTLDQGGHFLSLERSFGLATGFNAQIFQIATGGATDISGFPALKGDFTGITPIYKRLLLDLSELNIPLDNLEGMTLGPRLPDGTQSLVLVSDDNFNDLQTTQFLLFRIQQK